MTKKNNRPAPSAPGRPYDGRPAGLPRREALLRLLDEALNLGALDNPSVLQLFQAAAAAPWDPTVITLIEDALQPFRIASILHPDPLRPYPGRESGLDTGSTELGVIHETGLPWRLDPSTCGHALVAGPTGKGKTRFVYTLIAGLARTTPAILVTAKTDAARLLVDPPIFDRALLFDELRLALFTPPQGVEPEAWQRRVVELFARVFGLQYSRALLHESCAELHRLYTQYGQRLSRTVTFTPRALYQWVKRKKSKYLEGVVAAMEMLLPLTGSTLECSRGFCLESLLLKGASLIMIPDLYDDRVARFVVDWLMEYLFAFLERNGPNDGSVQLWFFMDDAHRFVSQAAEKDALMPLSHRYLVVRQSGIRIGVVSQCPSDLCFAAMGQASVLVQVGGLVHNRDCQAMGSAMGLPPPDWPRLQSVKQGEFVARENLGRYDRAFGGCVCNFPSPTRPFSEQERLRLMAPVLSSLPWEAAVPLPVVEQAIGAPAGGKGVATGPGSISPEAWRAAADMLQDPFVLLHERFQRMGLTGNAALSVKRELLRAGWAREHRIPRRGRPPVLLEPLIALAQAMGRPLPSWGKGGFVHAYVQYVVVTRLRSLGYSAVQTERFFGSKAVDAVGLSPTGNLEGVEVSISLANIVDNLEKDFAAQPAFASILAVCLSASDVRQAQRAIAKAPALKAYQTRIRVEPVCLWL